VSGHRPFDDDRWPDEEGFAVCFLCGHKIDPRDPNRGTYTPNAKSCEPIPAHLSPCLENGVKDSMSLLRLQASAMQALMEMGEANMKRFRAAARVSIVDPMGN
jgi:hypothetical protein